MFGVIQVHRQNLLKHLLACIVTLKMEIVHSFETGSELQQTTRRIISEDSSFHSHSHIISGSQLAQ
jgi:hypothetical protein